MKVVENLE